MGETVLTTILQLLKPELIEIASTFFSSLPYESEESFMLYVSNFFNSFEKFDKFLEKAASISSLSPNTSYKMVLSTFPLILPNHMHNQGFFQQSLVSNLSRSQLSNPLLKFGLIFFYNNLYSHFISQLSMYVDKPRDDISDLCELFAEFCLQEFETNLEYLINLLLLPKWGIALSNLSLYCMDNSVYFRMKSYFFNPNNDKKVGYIFFENVEYFGYLEYNNDTFIFQDYRLLDTLIEPLESENITTLELEYFSSFMYNFLGQLFIQSEKNTNQPHLGDSDYIQKLFKIISNYIANAKGKTKTLKLMVLLANFSNKTTIGTGTFISRYLITLPTDLPENVNMLTPSSILSGFKECIKGKNFATKFRKKKNFVMFKEWNYNNVSQENISAIFEHVVDHIIKFSENCKKLSQLFTQIAAFSLSFWLGSCIPKLLQPSISAFCKRSVVITFLRLLEVYPISELNNDSNDPGMKIRRAATDYLLIVLCSMKVKPDSITKVYDLYEMKQSISNTIKENQIPISNLCNFLGVDQNKSIFQTFPPNDFPPYANSLNQEDLPDTNNNEEFQKNLDENSNQNIFQLAQDCFESNELVLELCQLIVNENENVGKLSAKSIEKMILKRYDHINTVLNFLLELLQKYKMYLGTYYISFSALAFFLNVVLKILHLESENPSNSKIAINNDIIEKLTMTIIYSLCSTSVEVRKLSIIVIQLLKQIYDCKNNLTSKNTFVEFIYSYKNEIADDAVRNISMYARPDIIYSRCHQQKLKFKNVIQTRSTYLILFYISSLGKSILKYNKNLAQSIISNFFSDSFAFQNRNELIVSLIFSMIELDCFFSVSSNTKIPEKDFIEIYNNYFEHFDLKIASILVNATPSFLNYFLAKKNKALIDKSDVIMYDEFHTVTHILRFRANDITENCNAFTSFIINHAFSTQIINKTPDFSIQSNLITDEIKFAIFNMAIFTHKKLKGTKLNGDRGYFNYEPLLQSVLSGTALEFNDEAVFWFNMCSYHENSASLENNVQIESKTISNKDLSLGNENEGNFIFLKEKLPIKSFNSVLVKALFDIVHIHENQISNALIPTIIDKLPILYEHTRTAKLLSKLIFSRHFSAQILEYSKSNFCYFCGFLSLFENTYSENHNAEKRFLKFDYFIFSNIGTILALCLFYIKKNNDNFQDKVLIYKTLSNLFRSFDKNNALLSNFSSDQYQNKLGDDIFTISTNMKKIFSFCDEQFIHECLILGITEAAVVFLDLSNFSYDKLGLSSKTLSYFRKFSVYSLLQLILKTSIFSNYLSGLIDMLVASNSNLITFFVHILSYIIYQYDPDNMNSNKPTLEQLRTAYGYLYSKNPEIVFSNFLCFFDISSWHFFFLRNSENLNSLSVLYNFLVQLMIDFVRENVQCFINNLDGLILIQTFCLLFNKEYDTQLLIDVLYHELNENEISKVNKEKIHFQFNLEYLFSWAVCCGDLSIAVRALELLVDNGFIISDIEHLNSIVSSLHIICQFIIDYSKSNVKNGNETSKTNYNNELDYIFNSIKLLSNSTISLLTQDIFDLIINFLSFKTSHPFNNKIVDSAIEFIHKVVKSKSNNISFINAITSLLTASFSDFILLTVFNIFVELIGCGQAIDEALLVLSLIPFYYHSLSSASSNEKPHHSIAEASFSKFINPTIKESLESFKTSILTASLSQQQVLDKIFSNLISLLDDTYQEIIFDFYSKISRSQSYSNSSFFIGGFMMNLNIIKFTKEANILSLSIFVKQALISNDNEGAKFFMKAIIKQNGINIPFLLKPNFVSFDFSLSNETIKTNGNTDKNFKNVSNYPLLYLYKYNHDPHLSLTRTEEFLSKARSENYSIILNPFSKWIDIIKAETILQNDKTNDDELETEMIQILK